MLRPARFQRLLLGFRSFLCAAGLALSSPAATGQSVDFSLPAQSGAETDGTLTATVELSLISALDVVVDYTVGGTALEGSDFSVAPNPVTISAGSLTADITITLTDDALDEDAETIVLTLLDPPNADLGTVTVHTATVSDDDPEPTLQFDLSSSSVGEGAGTTALSLSLSAPSGRPVSVPFSASGTAIDPDDYTFATSSPLSIPAGDMTASIDLSPVDDALFEGDEGVQVDLGTPTNAGLGANTSHLVTLSDDDPEPTLQFDLSSSSVGEGAGTTALSLSLSAPSGLAVSVPFSASGTATDPDDYTLATASPLMIPAGDTLASIDLSPADDGLFEGDEDVQVDLGTPANAGLGANTSHLVTLTDDEPTPTLEFELAAQTVAESVGMTSFDLVLSGPSADPVSAGYQSTGSAVEPADFSATPNPALFAPGETRVTLQLAVVDDGDVEGQEAIELTLDAPLGADLGTQTVHTTTVTDNEGPEVRFVLASQSVGEGSGTALVTVELSQQGLSDIEVSLAVAGDATEGVDYTLSPNPVLIPAGSLSQDITLTLNDDALDEFDEGIDLTLGTPTNAMLGAPANHVTTLTDDDPLPTVQFRLLRTSWGEDEGPFGIDVDLSEVSGRDVLLDLATSGRAKQGPDYALTPQPFSIPAGSSSAQLTFTPNDDAFREGAEQSQISIAGTTHADPGLRLDYTVRLLDDEDVTSQPTVRALSVDSPSLDLGGPIRGGEQSAPQTVTVRNEDLFDTVTVLGAATRGGDKDSFSVLYPEGAPPIVLGPGQETTFDVVLSPTVRGSVASSAVVLQTPAGVVTSRVSLSGLAVGPTGGELLVNVGDVYLASTGDLWNAEYGLVSSNTTTFTTLNVAGTDDPELYAFSRRGTNLIPLSYAFALDDGAYDVILHFVEPTKMNTGQRLLDISLEGQVVLTGLDLFGQAGNRSAYQETLRTVVEDGQLDLSIAATVSNPVLSAIEVRSVPVVSVTPEVLDYFIVDQGEFVTQPINVHNTGLHEALIDTVTFQIVQGSAADFSIQVEGQEYFGSSVTASHSVASIVAPGTSMPYLITFQPTAHEDHQVDLQLSGSFDETLEVTLGATGGADADWGFLHPVLDSDPALIVDYELDGSEDVRLLGSESHTHEPGHILTAFEWSEGGVPFASVADPNRIFSVGDTSVSLTITDDNAPASTATDERTISVFSANAVPGPLATYYSDRDPLSLLDAVPAQADFVERLAGLQLFAKNGLVSGSPYAGDVMVVIEADFDVATPASYEFVVNGGAGQRIEVDGMLGGGPLALAAGAHSLQVRVALEDLLDLPLSVDVLIDSVLDPSFAQGLTHGELGVPPVIHDMPTIGNDLGGNLISIFGFGFYPEAQVVVHWGAQDFLRQHLVSYSADRLELLSPPGTGQVQVTVETPAGLSEARTFTYSPTGPVPITFDLPPAGIVSAAGATRGEWGPDGRFYVGQISGEIKAITYDEDYTAIDVQTYAGVSGLNNSDVLGIAFNPWDPPSPVRIYVSHGEHFLNGGGSFSGPSPYTGQVSRLTGPNFDTPEYLITRLPTSNHDHSVNGMLFDDNGDLLVNVGGNTNAGVKWPQIGDLFESPLSGAVLEAPIWRPDFNGTIAYIETQTGVVNNDQVFGDMVDVRPGSHVAPLAVGIRNGFDLTLTTWGDIYVTDNGPNNGFGPESTGAQATSGNHPQTPDELQLLEPGAFYGHPNRNRGRYDPRQNVYHGVVEPSIPGVFTQNIATLESSTNGLVEYRAQTFNGQMRGELLVQKWNFRSRRLKLNASRDAVVEVNDVFPHVSALDVNIGPGGAIVSVDYSGNRVAVLVPDDISVVGLAVHDVFPWRAPAGGGTRFVLGGENFGTSLGATSVTFDGIAANLTSVSEKRIVGVVPAHPAAPEGLVDIEITVGLDSVMLPASFRYLAPTPGAGHGTWNTRAPLPQPLGEVSAAVIEGQMYLVGEGNAATFAYDILGNTWRSDLAVRPFNGNHHGSEVVAGKWYLIGGLSSGAGRVQIYDPVLDSWSSGATMPWSGGSVATCVIDGLIYAAGGIVGSSTVNNVAVYDPLLDTWTALPSLPSGVNHAAASTDGERFYVFGGRQGPNMPQPGFDDVQVYDPMTASWDSSDAPLSDLEPLPEGRGGTGHAVYYRGEFYVMGGETNDPGDPSATLDRVYPQVYAYDPLTHTWRRDADLPTARHGIYPVRFQGRILVAGGGVIFGNSQTTELEVFRRY